MECAHKMQQMSPEHMQMALQGANMRLQMTQQQFGENPSVELGACHANVGRVYMMGNMFTEAAPHYSTAVQILEATGHAGSGELKRARTDMQQMQDNKVFG